MDKPNGQQSPMAIIHHTDGENNSTTSEEIHSLLKFGEQDNTTINRRIFVLHNTSPHPSICPRTPSPPNIAHPNTRNSRHSTSPIPNNIPDKHKQQKNQTTNILNSNEIIPPPNNDHNSSRRKRKISTDDLLNEQPTGSPYSSPRNEAKQTTSPSPGSSGTRHIQHSDESPLPTPSPSASTNPNGTDDTDGAGTTYTFILHKSTFDILPPTTTTKSPTFATFDHGDHIHIIYAVKHCNNAARQLNTILNFIKTKFEGTTEAHTTLQLIRFPNRFLSYLIRKGLSTFNKYGTRSIAIIKPLMEALLRFDTTDNIPRSSLPCDQYIEEKKKISKQTVNNRTFSIDYISNLITENGINSYESFQRILPTQTKIQLLKQLGYVGQNIIKTLIKIHNIETLQSIKTTHFYQIIHNISLHEVNPKNVSWLTKLFRSNNINIPHFFSHFLAIHSMNITKINSFILQGPTNTGKSLLLNILLTDAKPTRIARERDKSNFHLDQLPNSTSVIFEEPIIDQTTIGTWKLLLEGAPLPTDMKHSDKELINRLPIFITTNQQMPPGMYQTHLSLVIYRS
jgi:hypothetical protein